MTEWPIVSVAEVNELEIVLDRLKSAVTARLSAEMLADVTFDAAVDVMTGDVVARFKRESLALPLDDVNVSYPSNWVEAVKDRWAPEWIRRRWPTRRTVHRVRVYDEYPSLPIPPGHEPVRIVIQHRYEARDVE